MSNELQLIAEHQLTCNGIPTQHLQLPASKEHEWYNETDSLPCYPQAGCTDHTHHNIDKSRHQKRPEEHVTPYLYERNGHCVLVV